MLSSLFLTAYDPTDLPGGSIDPLGFTGAYNALVEALLPGLTGAAGEPAYFPVLCAAVHFAGEDGGGIPDGASRVARKRWRADVAMRLERAWALACVAAKEMDQEDKDATTASGNPEQAIEEGAGEDDGRLPGLRGVTYVRREYERIQRGRFKKVGTRYPLLSRQYTYGMVGLYGNVAARLGLLDQEDFALTPSLGTDVAHAFLDATAPDAAFRKTLGKLAVSDDARVGLDELAGWGRLAMLGVTLPPSLATPLHDGLVCDPHRQAALQLIQQAQERHEGNEDDLTLLEICHAMLDVESCGLAEVERLRLLPVLDAVVKFEHVYLWAMLGFERLLRLARDAGDVCHRRDLSEDEALQRAHDALGERLDPLDAAAARLSEVGEHDCAHRLRDVAGFVHRFVTAPDISAFSDALLARHRDVQHGKFDRGRRKLPWVEARGDTLAITSTRAGGQPANVTEPAQIPLHTWRTWAARAFLHAVGGVA